MSPRRPLVIVVVTAFATTTLASVASADPLVVAAGDIACSGHPCPAQRSTARLVGRLDPRAVLTLGDNQYDAATLAEFRSSYDPTWGRFMRRTFPTPGNHEYAVPGARGYFAYFGRRAHPGTGGTYSFDLGRWHLLAINSRAGSITEGHLRWIRRDLRRDRGRCQLAYWHHPRWSSGSHGSNPAMKPLWKVLFRARVDVVLNGHDHSYERFAPMTPGGRLARRGIRQFVVGTGGAELYPLGPAAHGSRRRIDGRYGVLQMRLHERSSSWRFTTIAGKSVDRGTAPCH